MRRVVERWLVAVVCAAIGWFYVWTVQSNADEWSFEPEQNDYFNLLIDGWLDGQLHMKVPVPDALLKLEDPYDPTLRPPGLGLHDASFYRGKYYLYFGAAPAVLVMLPYRLMTGMDLPLAVAVFIFSYGGFLASVAIWRGVRRRYFPETGAGVMVVGVLVLGLASLGPVLMRRPHMWELPIAAGYALALLALGAVWRSLQAESSRARMGWFAAAALALGLAVASRPTYLLATPLLASPWAWWWRAERRIPWQLALAAVAPLAVVGSLMAWHNYARFGNPLQFGQAYQFSLDYESKMAHFRFGHVPFNAWRYFFSAANWYPFFPFIEPAALPPKPPGFGGHDDVYGILRNLPIAWLALAAPLALRRRTADERGRLGAWLGAAATLAAIMAGVLLFFFGSLARYQLDFTPVLMLLACVGLLAVERELRETRWAVARPIGRAAWMGAAMFSAGFAVLFSLQLGDRLRARNPAKALEVARAWNWIPHLLDQVRGREFGPLELSVRLAGATAGEHTLVRVGEPARADRVVVAIGTDGRARFGLVREGAPAIFGRAQRWEGAGPHAVRVTLGSLYPPAAHPYFGDMSVADAGELTRQVKIEVDGETVLDERRAFPADAGEFRMESPALHVAEIRQTGAERPALRRPEEFMRLRVSWPVRPATPVEPLIAVGGADDGALLFVHYADDAGQIALGCSVRGERVFESERVPVDVSRVQELTVRWTRTADPARRLLELRLDGMIVASREVAWIKGKSTHVIGKNVNAVRGCAPVFTGVVHHVQRGVEGRDPLEVGAGSTLRMRVQWPVPPAPGTRDPLVVTGRAGAGDFLMVEYVDAETVRFSFDHWGGGGGTSGPVPMDFGRAHDLKLTFGPRVEPDLRQQLRHARRGIVRVWLDGVAVWTHPAVFYAAEPDELAVGRNPIGGTSCGPVFTGSVLAAERVGHE